MKNKILQYSMYYVYCKVYIKFLSTSTVRCVHCSIDCLLLVLLLMYCQFAIGINLHYLWFYSKWWMGLKNGFSQDIIGVWTLQPHASKDCILSFSGDWIQPVDRHPQEGPVMGWPAVCCRSEKLNAFKGAER